MTTIFALATPPGRGAIAIYRLSGPDVRLILQRLGVDRLRPRMAQVRDLEWDGQALDQALVLWFPAPKSYTGEDVAELHLHGGRAVVEAVGQALLDAGARLAEPGEFTRRAFENGRLDLAQAEAVADLINAESSAQARQALGQLGGALSHLYDGFRTRLLQALALVEAEIDFPDEEVPEGLARTAGPILETLAGDLRLALADADRGERVRDGYRIVLIGEPNAGKSSLFNALVERDAAIVTAIPGTTRDVLEVQLVVGGYAVSLADTAGLRGSDDQIEAEGVRRARIRAETADLRLWVLSPEDGPGEAASFARPDDLVVQSKSDLGLALAPAGFDTVQLSLVGGQGLEALQAWILARLDRDLAGADFPAATRARHRQRLTEALTAVEAAIPRLVREPELAGDDLRRAAVALGRVTGQIGVEDVLGEVFSNFCIGK